MHKRHPGREEGAHDAHCDVRIPMELHPRESADTPAGLDAGPAETVTQGAPEFPSLYPGHAEAIDSGSQRKDDASNVVYESSGSSYEVPIGYGEDRVTLLVRDPQWIYAYWELSGALPSLSDDAFRCVIRVYLTDRTGSHNQGLMDIPIEAQVSNWYINVPASNRMYVAELGRLYCDGTFIPIVRSNVVHTPPASVSDKYDVEWMSVDHDFYRLYSNGLVTYMDGSEEHLKGKLALAHLAEYMASPMGPSQTNL